MIEIYQNNIQLDFELNNFEAYKLLYSYLRIKQ